MKKYYIAPETSFDTMSDSEEMLMTSPIINVNPEAEEVTEVDGRDFQNNNIWDDED